VSALDGRTLVVEFPRAQSTLRFAGTAEALVPVDLGAGRPVRITATGEETLIESVQPDGTFVLANGRSVAAHALWPLELEGALLERLAVGDLDDLDDFITRMNLLHLLGMREAGGMGTFLGGRVRLFPHQLYVADRASSTDPVRWLLADEVGLGKTIEASLILNRLVHMGKVNRCLIVAPDTLTVQWLGELWRKYHKVFTLLDSDRLADVTKDFGEHFNPFGVHRRSVISIEMLIERPELTAQAVQAGIDLLIVDEAQHLQRPPGHPGNAAWRAIAPIAAVGKHLLLLSATPLEDDAHGFFRLLQLLRPEDFPEDMSIEARLAQDTPLPACTSATRRADIGGLPPRVGIPIDLSATATVNAKARTELERAVRSAPAAHAVAEREKIHRVHRALASGAALAAVLGPNEAELKKRAIALDAADPRIQWLVRQAPAWRDAKEKTLVFVAHRETLEMIRTIVGERAHVASGVFHEELTPARRDTEVARFREIDGPSLLVSTECGGEGRNFEFCRRLILFDLPWKPSVVEQRIGRLDRIGRRIPVEVVYFRPAAGIGRDVVRLFETLGVFQEPLAGIEPQLAPMEGALESIALDPDASLSDAKLEELVAEVHAARSRVREAAYQHLHRHPFRPEMAAGILGRIPKDLDALNQEVVVTASIGLGFTIAHPPGHRVFSIEIGNNATVNGLPGVAGGASYVGTFEREEAVENESLDFFASGHPLVEGIFAHYDESPIGRAVRFEITFGKSPDAGLIAIYKDGPAFEIVAIDLAGNSRPDWAEAFFKRPISIRPIAGAKDTEWRAMVRRLGAMLDPARRLYAVAAVEIRPAK
jgi:ATP-dependent helicase HepA